MTPRADDLDGPVAEFVGELATWCAAPPPPPAPPLRELFARSAVVTPPAVVTPRRSPMSESKRLVAAVPAKIAAGVLGALLAGSLGAGAMTGTITLTSEKSDATEATETLVEDDAVAAEQEDLDVEVDEADAGNVDEVDEVDLDAEGEAKVTKDAGDPATAPVPTSVSEAAKNHQFDEACGNHGAYVSHFARTGEEPECATAARGAAAAPETTEVQAAETTDDEAAPEVGKGKGEANASARGVERSEAGKAKAAANKAKAPGRAKAGR